MSEGFDLTAYLKSGKDTVEEALGDILPASDADPESLHSAMRYSLMADGKRIRPILTLATADVLGIPRQDVLPIACALEMIHVFSLIHDDLPAMDDDDLRRGQPTNHKVYGEAVAILAGDGLLAQAFVPLTNLDHGKYGAVAVLRVIRLIAESAGTPGMIGGQVIDLECEGKCIALARLQTLHRKKTGALICAAVTAPAVLRDCDSAILARLSAYGDAIGLAFQIADDILDIEGGSEIGKDIGSDVTKRKSTYPSLLGLDGAKRECARVMESALTALEGFSDKADPLRALARFIVERKK